MQRLIKTSALFLMLTAFTAIPPKHDLTGRWRISYPNGTNDFLELKQDGTFRNFSAAGKTLHQGKYKYTNDVFSINDKEGCGDTYWATYKMTFHGEDSISYSVIQDTCTGRRVAIDGGGLKRIKAIKVNN